MSLRYQISVRILLISLCILFLGGSIGIWQARQSVSNEVDSSISLALQLIKIGIGSNKTHQTDWMFRLSRLKQTRHLNIQLKTSSGEIVNISDHPQLHELDKTPPDWFINLVLGEYPKIEYPIETLNNIPLKLIIQANPMDEISEVWQESIAFFTSLFALVFLTFLSVQLVFNKTIKSIHSIIEHLKGIETGDYQKKLADFSTQEYDDIAKAINHMTDVLGNTEKQNRALTQHSLEIQEEERQRLSQELHDEFGQSLTAIKVMAVTAAHEKTDTQKITTSMIEICDHLMTVVRSMMKQLHPLILTELGLKATLDDLLHHWEVRNTPTMFTLHYDDAVDQIDRTIVIQIFRVIQESLTNIIRHAQATQVNISLQIKPDSDKLILLITDDGLGCDLDQLSSGFGLLGMKERIKLLGGDFKIQSQVNKGLQIKAEIPLL
ncbi:histidine kinase [Methyloprofundus sedimenti]|uniref:histidine kinase n=1 Tax=Methyloprofundus sedimenti TaxID=1420851 RepID=A0A1V8M5M4_9GAMM|nr:sensor histidine kinase [Methyloprofundus sedimenti]OQK16806.1 histidine kinase [Methyloprofundus sedimenti]